LTHADLLAAAAAAADASEACGHDGVEG
jgi:hypothetical protein